ncbi:MAG: BrnT family toxin, partial [Candidatus Anammoxibacter sp.]
MEFEWDAAKNQINIKKHGVDFDEAKTVFDDILA